GIVHARGLCGLRVWIQKNDSRIRCRTHVHKSCFRIRSVRLPVRVTVVAGYLNEVLRSTAGSWGRGEDWTDLVALENLQRRLFQSGSKVDDVVRRHSLKVERWGLGWKRLRRSRPLSLGVGLRHSTLFDWPERPAVRA